MRRVGIDGFMQQTFERQVLEQQLMLSVELGLGSGGWHGENLLIIMAWRFRLSGSPLT
jgi:hypothetical protein